MTDNIEILKEYYKAFNSHRLDKVFSFFTDDFYQISATGRRVELPLLREHLGQVFESVPDLQLNYVKGYSNGEEYAIEFACSGTHLGVFKGLPGTGKRFELTGVHLFKMEEGKIKFWRPIYNERQLLNQFSN